MRGSVSFAVIVNLFVFIVSQRQGGPPPVYRTEVNPKPLDIILGAPTDNSITASVRSQRIGNVQFSVFQDDKKIYDTSVEIAETSKPVPLLLDHLRSSTSYSYTATFQSGDNKSEALKGSFVTARKRGASFTFDIQADSHLDGNTNVLVYENTLKNMIADRPDFLVDLGDTFMVDKYKVYQDSIKQYDAQRYWFSVVGLTMPVFLCLGNHDGETGWAQRSGIGTSDWCREQRQLRFPVIKPSKFYSGAPAKGLYYSFEWGDALFLVLDPFVATTRKPRSDDDGWNWTLGDAQYKWLEKTVANTKSKYKFVFIHHLVGGLGRDARGGVEGVSNYEWGGSKEFNKYRPQWTMPIHDLFVKNHVTAVFHGHDHLYCRQEKDGLLYIEVPQPGQPRENAINSAEEYGYKSGKLLGSSGHVRVSVGPEKGAIEYVRSKLTSGNREIADRVEIQPGH